MTSLVYDPPVPSELNDEVDDTDLSPGVVWAYPCKLPACPDYGKSWGLRSNFLLHLQEREEHGTSVTTPALRRAIEITWRYATDPYLSPRAPPDLWSREDPDEQVWDYSFRDHSGKVTKGRGTLKQMEMQKASRCPQATGAVYSKAEMGGRNVDEDALTNMIMPLTERRGCRVSPIASTLIAAIVSLVSFESFGDVENDNYSYDHAWNNDHGIDSDMKY